MTWQEFIDSDYCPLVDYTENGLGMRKYFTIYIHYNAVLRHHIYGFPYPAVSLDGVADTWVLGTDTIIDNYDYKISSFDP